MIDLPPLSEEARQLLCHDPAYDHVLLRQFRFWDLYLYERSQQHFGRAYAWFSARHIDCQGFDTLSGKEVEELQVIIGLYREALRHIVHAPPALINCEWLGNEIGQHRGHGHMHLIPRFRHVPVWKGRPYPDERFGSRSGYGRFRMPPEEQSLLVARFRQELAR